MFVLNLTEEERMFLHDEMKVHQETFRDMEASEGYHPDDIAYNERCLELATAVLAKLG